MISQGLPTTSVARALLAVAPAMPADELGRLVEESILQRRTSHRALRALVDHVPGARGTAILRELLDDALEPSITLSEAERRLRALLHRAGLPQPRTNHRVGRFRPDFVWPQERLVVEMDGFRFHRSRQAFERDRARDQDLVAAGYVVIRVTWRQITREPERVLTRIAMALARAQRAAA